MRDQSLARSFQVVFRRRKLFRCEFCRRKKIGPFADRRDSFCIKYFVNWFYLALPDFKVLTHRMNSEKDLERTTFTGMKGHIVTGFLQRKLTFWGKLFYISILKAIICENLAFLEKSEYRREKKKCFSFNLLDPAKFVSFDLGCIN